PKRKERKKVEADTWSTKANFLGSNSTRDERVESMVVHIVAKRPRQNSVTWSLTPVGINMRILIIMVHLRNCLPISSGARVTTVSLILYSWTWVSGQMHTLIDLAAELGFFEQLILLDFQLYIG